MRPAKRKKLFKLKLFFLIWKSRLTHWYTFSSWIGLKGPLAYWGIYYLEKVVGDSELILEVQAQQYQETAEKFRKSDGEGSQMIAHIYETVAERLHDCALDVYVSFK